MERKRISSPSPFEAIIGISRAVRVGNIIKVSGTAPIAPDGTNASVGDVYSQAKRCLEIIRKAIEDAGGSLSDVVRTRMFLVNRTDWDAVSRAHGEFFKNIRPASTIVVVEGFVDPEWLVEIEAECILAD